MNGRRAIVGLCMLCALLVSAFAAQSASAVTNGTTAFTCKPTPGEGQFVAAHCKNSDKTGPGFTHTEIKQAVTTEFKISNEGLGASTNQHIPATLKATISGVETELSATKVHGTGWLENKKEENGEHYIHGEVAKIEYTEVEVTKPAGKGCIVYADAAKTEPGIVRTDKLTFTSTGQGDSLKFTPVGARFATFWIGGCEIEALNGEYPVTGSATGTADGATLSFTEAKTTETLKIKNAFTKAGFAGEATVSSKAPADGSFTPLSVTTVETQG